MMRWSLGDPVDDDDGIDDDWGEGRQNRRGRRIRRRRIRWIMVLVHHGRHRAPLASYHPRGSRTIHPYPVPTRTY